MHRQDDYGIEIEGSNEPPPPNMRGCQRLSTCLRWVESMSDPRLRFTVYLTFRGRRLTDNETWFVWREWAEFGFVEGAPGEPFAAWARNRYVRGEDCRKPWPPEWVRMNQLSGTRGAFAHELQPYY